MHKFNVGDRVNAKYATIGGTATVVEVDRRGNFHHRVKFDEFPHDLWIDNNNIKPIEVGPIRTVARREIVPGNYGLIQMLDNGCMYIETDTYTADQCREAAHVLNQIAEALEDAR